MDSEIVLWWYITSLVPRLSVHSRNKMQGMLQKHYCKEEPGDEASTSQSLNLEPRGL